LADLAQRAAEKKWRQDLAWQAFKRLAAMGKSLQLHG
jgi:hypothetical protein